MKSIEDIIQENNSDESTVAWLIEELQKFPKNLKVCLDYNDDGIHIYEDIVSVRKRRNVKTVSNIVCLYT